MHMFYFLFELMPMELYCPLNTYDLSSRYHHIYKYNHNAYSIDLSFDQIRELSSSVHMVCHMVCDIYVVYFTMYTICNSYIKHTFLIY